MLVQPERGVGVSQKRTGSVYVCKPATSGVHSASKFTFARAIAGPQKNKESSTAAYTMAPRSTVLQRPQMQMMECLNLCTSCDTHTAHSGAVSRRVARKVAACPCEAVGTLLILDRDSTLLPVRVISRARRPQLPSIAGDIVGCKHDTSSKTEETRHSVRFMPELRSVPSVCPRSKRSDLNNRFCGFFFRVLRIPGCT
jgi:hypothetical protein